MDTGRIRSARRWGLLNGFILLSVGLNLSEADWTPTGLWLAVVASGLYHGMNPGMGWPLAVSSRVDGKEFARPGRGAGR